MAEAHEAVAFSFSINHEGKFNFNLNSEVILVAWNLAVRAFKKQFARLVNAIRNGVFPARPSSWLYFILFMFLASLRGWSIPQYGVQYVEMGCKWLGQTEYTNATACVIFSLMVWLVGVILRRLILQLLLNYHGWLYEPFGRVSKITKIWMLLVKLFIASRPRLYGYQPFLPKLRLPSLNKTINRYLRSVRPLLSDSEYEEMVKLSQQFKKQCGLKLQFFLHLKHWWSKNYVSDWWEDFIYLSGRGSIMVNSNYYCLDTVLHGKMDKLVKRKEEEHFMMRTPSLYKSMAGLVSQTARAANVVYWILQHRRKIDRQELNPILVNNAIPLCSWQYERQFNTTRIPGKVKDYLKHSLDSYHIAVYHKGRYYKCYFTHRGRLLTPIELQVVFDQVLKDNSQPSVGEEHLAALTATDRTTWADAREKYFSKGINKPSLDAIEKAAFFLTFDDEEYEFDPEDDTKLSHYARSMLHGSGYDRWFDKSFTLVVSKNGKIGVNAEHSWADAPIMGHLWEYVLGMDALSCIRPDGVCGYTDDGNCISFVEHAIPAPIRLKWDINAECNEIIEKSLASARTIIDDLDLHVLVHSEFGKGIMKKCHISPDAFIQLAMQLACFKMAGKFYLTYESSMTRLFLNGRTETIRSCSLESCAFVQTMLNPNATNASRIDALKKAVSYHQTLCHDAMDGNGVDRHMFALYVVDQYLGTNSPFLKKVIQQPWRLSTSQTPSSQTNSIDYRRQPDLISAGGGFGPVADDGYGVSYIIVGEDLIFFHISSKRSCSTTDSHKMGQAIRESMEMIKNLFFPSKKI